MKTLGATPFYYRAEADDAVGLEMKVEPWLEGLPKALQEMKQTIQNKTDEELLEIGKPCSLYEMLQNSEAKEEDSRE
jgi:hypothetical protein